ncbi:MAG: DEAD/DEAH box helicase, partial [Filifactoraceae bacterium]
MENKKFCDLGLSDEVLKSLESVGYEVATPIQEMAIPIGLSGVDFIGQSQTGTGKTLAFSIPIIEGLDRSINFVQSLILCPTRELAVQVSKEITKLTKFNKTKVVAIYGGESIEKQIRSLKSGAHVVVGTPGRLLDHVKRKTLKLDMVKFVVLDEADEMLDMGFIEDIESILRNVHEYHQTMLFSATMPKEIVKLSNKYLNDPKLIKIENKTVTVDRIEQSYIRVKQNDKTEVLTRILDIENSKKSIIFCNTKRMVDELTAEMQNRGYLVEGLHGDLKQQKRDQVLERFKNGHVNVLIATDVAARGLDINNVDIVFNYDIPQEEEQYVHRIGRTGRAGKHGKSYSFAYGRELDRIRHIEKYAKILIKEESIPAYSMVEQNVTDRYISKISSKIEKGIEPKYYEIIDKIKEREISLEDFTAAMLKSKLMFRNNDIINIDNYHRKERRPTEKRGSIHEKRTKKSEGFSKEKGMIRFHLNIGKKHKVSISDIVGAVAGECNISGKNIGAVDLFE